MAETIVSDLAGRLLEIMVKEGVKSIAPYFGGTSELNKLEDTMEMIQARLIDAEKRQEEEDGATIKVWLRRLKRVLYKLEDLFEEVEMAGHAREQMSAYMKANPVCLFDRLKLNKKVSQDVKAIKEDLESIKSDEVFFRLNAHNEHQYAPHYEFNVQRETHSLITEDEVIGREHDKEAIVKMLLDSQHEGEKFSVIAIVGMGGLGKTTLAKLCFNDETVQKHFELKSWAYISVIGSLKELLMKILHSFKEGKCDDMTLDKLQSSLREVVENNRYLLVLDDLWDEMKEIWLDLKPILSNSKMGSKIIVTTRFINVAKIMGKERCHELNCLSGDESWNLFKSLAFRPGHNDTETLTSIGEEIVPKCVNVLLAIKTIARLLYSRYTEKDWMYFRDTELRAIETNSTKTREIMSALKLSYYYLPSPLKQCFAYCSIFPKGYEFSKEQLIWLWMAQGFVTSSRNKSPEDVGHEYFVELLGRCFFQDVKLRAYDGKVVCKMHDFFHDLACEVGDECCLVKEEPIDRHILPNTRHVNISIVHDNVASHLLSAKQLRSLLGLEIYSISMRNLSSFFSTMTCIRVLDLKTERPLESLKKLKHLRYLRLNSGLSRTPHESITRLQKLQTLDLAPTIWIQKLPRGFEKLISLRHLLLSSLWLEDMPPGFDKLTSLQTLNEFIVGENNGLDALGDMNLTGSLKIIYKKIRQNATREAKVAKLKDKKLTSLEFNWWKLQNEAVSTDLDGELECLQPPESLEKLEVKYWKGVRLPSWGVDEVPCLLPKLVSITIENCEECQYLPSFSRLPLLRFLHLSWLPALKYMEDEGEPSNNTNSEATAMFYPSLEELELANLPELEGWSRQHSRLLRQPKFPRLSKVEIIHCPKLMSMPMAPKLDQLPDKLVGISRKLLHQLVMSRQEASSSSSKSTTVVPESKKLSIGEVDGIKSFSVTFYPLESLEIYWCEDMESLTAESPNFLRHLQVRECNSLKDISAALQHLSALEKLEFYLCQRLDLGDGSTIKDDNINEEESMINITSTGIGSESTYWQGLTSLRSMTLWGLDRTKSLPKGLCSLTKLEALHLAYLPSLTTLPDSFGNLTQLCHLELSNCDELTSLPDSFGNLSQLRSLTITTCPKLTSLPDSLANLTALQTLGIYDCPELSRRCKQPDGDYCSLVQHVRNVHLGSLWDRFRRWKH